MYPNSQTTIQSGGDTNLIGSQVKGKRVELIAENLNIESLQDRSSYDGKQMNISDSITIGYGFSAGGSYNKSKVNADHASINEQAGIYAGDEGYDINVNKHTDLKGALITSTQKAEADGKNHFSTGSLTHSDIENHSNYSGSSFGVSGSVAANFGTPLGKNGQAQSGVQAKNAEGQPLYRDANGKETTVKTDNPILTARWDSVETTHSVGFGYDKDMLDRKELILLLIRQIDMNKPKTVSVIVNNEFLLVTPIIRGMIGMTDPDQDFIFNQVDISDLDLGKLIKEKLNKVKKFRSKSFRLSLILKK